MSGKMTRKYAVIDGKSVPVGDDPRYDYARDYRRARSYTPQAVTCSGCRVQMRCIATQISPLYGCTGAYFKCDNCGVSVSVFPAVKEVA